MNSATIRLRPASILPVLALAWVACGDNGGGDPGVDAAPPDANLPLPGLTVLDFEIAVDVSPDGRLAVFEDLTQTEALLVFHDTVTGQTSTVGTVGDPGRTLATGVSNDGRVSALHSEPVQAGLWRQADGWLDLGSPHATGCGEDLSGGWDISADGHVAVGLAWDGCATTAFRWSDASGAGAFATLARLGTPPAGASRGPINRATVVSDDGRVAAGFAEDDVLDRHAAVWNADGSGFLISGLPADAPSEVLSISADGATIAGSAGNEGFVWTQAGGLVDLVRFDVALPSDPVFANAMSGDGSHVYGGVGSAFFGVPIAFVWTAATGMRPLADVATAAGITIPDGLLLTSVLGASADGTVLIGVASDADFNTRTFVLRLPAGA